MNDRLARLRDVADEYCRGATGNRVLLEQVCEQFLILADEKLTADGKPLDRGEAVNLARNWLDDPMRHITDNGIEALAKAVLAMDAYLLTQP